MDDPDADLLAAAGRGDGRATRALVDRKLPRLIALATRMLGDRTEAEDVAQESLLRLWRQASRWRRGEAKVDSWLHRVALNQCYDRLRRSRDSPAAQPPDSIDPSPRPDQALGRTEDGERLLDALQRLPDRQREAIILQYYQGLSNMEAARLMDVSVDALESLLARGRRALRAILMEDGHDA